MYQKEKRRKRKIKKNLFSLLCSPSPSLSETNFFFFFLYSYFIIIIFIWIDSSYYFIWVRFCLEIFYIFSIHFILNELSPCHFLISEIFVKISSLKSLATYHPENSKIFRRSQNLSKLFWVTRFCETNSTTQSVSSSEI